MRTVKASAERVRKEYDVALSFASEEREYVSQVNEGLREVGYHVFYDQQEKAKMWGKDMYVYLRDVYFKRAEYTILFASRHYAKKMWTNHELQSAQARAIQENREYILPARFDDTEIPGLLPTTFYIDLKTTSPAELVQLVRKKLGHVPRPRFFPEVPDRLYAALDADTAARRDEVLACAHLVFDALSLMSPEERRLLKTAAINACPAGLPNDIHLNLDYLARLSGLTPRKILSTFSRLGCLNISSRVYEKADEPIPDGALVRSNRVVELKFQPLALTFNGNGTEVLHAILKVLQESLCPECAPVALETLDLSILGSATGFIER